MADLESIEKAPIFNFSTVEVDQMVDEALLEKENILQNEYFHILIEKGVVMETPNGTETKKIPIFDSVDCDAQDIEKLIKKLKE